MVEYERDFKGVWIPKTVWLDERLNALDKIILTEIDSLDNGERGCFASNKHIADFCQCSETKVSTAISKLIKFGYLYVQKFDGRQRELKSRLSNFERQELKDCNAGLKDLKESNTDISTGNNTRKKKESKKDSFNEIILAYAKDIDISIRAEVTELLFDWLKVREAKRAAMTDRAIQMNIEKLNKLAAESKLTVVEYLKEVICRGWAAFFPINNYSQNKQYSNTPKYETINGKEYEVKNADEHLSATAVKVR